MNGRFRFWDGVRAYGFIRPDNSAEDVFCHATKIRDGGPKPRKGSRCEFYLGDARDGRKQAVMVRVFEPGAVGE